MLLKGRLKPLAIVLSAVLALSFIPLLAGQQAQALSAVTFTSLETVTSQGTGTFQRVYENGTSSVVFSDANRTAAYFKSSYNIGTDTLDTDVTTLTNTTYTATAFGYNSPVDLSRYSLSFDSTSQEYAQAAANTVFDITTQDFSIWGFFKRTTDSGSFEELVIKQTGAGVGYRAFISNADRLQAQIGDGSGLTTLTVATTLQTGIWYAWGASFDRDGNGNLYLYNMNTDALTSDSASITSRQNSLTNTQTFTVSRDSASSSEFFPGKQDSLNFLSGTAISQVDFTTFATTGTITGLTPTSTFDFNDGVGSLASDIVGSNDLTLFNTPTWSNDVLDESSSRLSTYIIGRDDNSDAIGVAKLNTADLSEVDDEYFSSNRFPKDIVQSTGSLYVPMYDNSTGSGNLYLASATRQFGSYAENSLYAGTESVPAHGVNMNVTSSGSSISVRAGGVTIAAEKATSSSVLVGKYIDRINLWLSKTGSPTGSFKVGVFDSSGNTLFTCATKDVSTLTTSEAKYSFMCAGQYQISANNYIGAEYTGGSVGNQLNVFYNQADVFDGTNSIAQQYQAGWANAGGVGGDVRGSIMEVVVKSVVYDSSPDASYHVFESGTNTIRVAKYTSSGSLLGTSLDHLSGKPFSVAQLTDRVIIQTFNATYQLVTSSDAITEIHNNNFLTRYPQTFSIAPAARTFNSAVMLVANATYATNYVPNTGSNARTGVFIDTITTGGSGTLTGYDPSKFYYLPTNDMVVDASTLTGTSWTIRDIGTKEQVSVTGYSEYVGIDLAENTTEILDLDVVKINCDNGNYLLEMQYVAVGNDDDCNYWWTYDDASGTAPRQLGYNAAGEVVHADDYDLYTFSLAVADPDVYHIETIYDGEDVDSGNFDAGGLAQQRLLYQQCYTISVTEQDTGNELQNGNICAGDDPSITISLSGIVIPDNWLGSKWSYSLTRYFNASDPGAPPSANSTNNHVLFTVQKNVSPYNASIHVFDNPDIAEATLDTWFNFTNVSGASVVNQTGINSNQTLYFNVYENDVVVVTAVSAGRGFENTTWQNNYGLLFGVPLAIIFPVMVALIFPKSQAHFGIIVVGAVIGVMQFMGYFNEIPFNEGLWAVAFALIALGVVYAKTR